MLKVTKPPQAPRRSRLWLLLLALTVLTVPASAFELQLEEIARSIDTVLNDSGKVRVAVVDFTDIHGNPEPLGSFLAEELSVSLVSSTAGFEVVDRIHLQTILDESELSRAGVFGRDTTRKLRDLAGVEALVTGRLTPSSTRVRVTVKVLDTETASLLGAASANLERDEFLNELLAGSDTGVSAAAAAAPLPQPASPSAEPEIRTDAPAATPSSPAPAEQAPAPPAPVSATSPQNKLDAPESSSPASVVAESEAPDELSSQPLPDAAASPPPASPAQGPMPPAVPPAQVPILEPVTISVQALRILESSVQVVLAVENNTASVLEWGESGGSRLTDSLGKPLICSDCPEGVDADAVLIPARAKVEVNLFFAHDPKAAALEERDAFAFFFNAKRSQAETFTGPFSLSLDYEYRGSGRKKASRSSAFFPDLLAGQDGD
ncbi:MAG: hypothetical protein GY769_16810 [bacterium]|nr:hypothetical protein [bacterium]